MGTPDLDRRLTALAALGEPLRRRLYHFVGGQDHAVSRDEAAEGADVSRSTAAFHLDRLVADGLLAAEFRRLSGRRGPGAGRPTKLYRRAAEISVSLPARRYDLAAELLAGAVSQATGSGAPVDVTVRDVARRRGAALAGGVTVPADVRAAVSVLAEQGYEPRLQAREVVLGNCPFSALAGQHAELVCGMNLALLDGFAGALPGAGLQARLEPSDRHCCVRLRRLAPPDQEEAP